METVSVFCCVGGTLTWGGAYAGTVTDAAVVTLLSLPDVATKVSAPEVVGRAWELEIVDQEVVVIGSSPRDGNVSSGGTTVGVAVVGEATADRGGALLVGWTLPLVACSGSEGLEWAWVEDGNCEVWVAGGSSCSGGVCKTCDGGSTVPLGSAL